MASPRNPAWRIVPASVAGPSHARLALVNQDHWGAQELGASRWLLAVADGAGSRERAQHGSLLAIEAAESAAKICFGSAPVGSFGEWENKLAAFAESCQQFFDRAVDGAARQLFTRTPSAPSADELRREYATTLLAVIADPPYFGIFGIGDGFLIVHRSPGGPHLVVAPPDREHRGGTAFLTSERRAEFLVRSIICDPSIQGLALCTDGLIEGVLAQRAAPDGRRFLVAPREFATYFEYFANPDVNPDDLARKLQGKDFAQTSNDDKTMLMAMFPACETAAVPGGKARLSDGALHSRGTAHPAWA
jgi:Protein phosphatase 2C